MTFFLKPLRRSSLPTVALSISTLAVSWNDAAERKLSVVSETLVIPNNSCSVVAPLFLSRSAFSFSSRRRLLSIISPDLLLLYIGRQGLYHWSWQIIL